MDEEKTQHIFFQDLKQMISDDLEGMENVILKIEASVGTDVNKVIH